MIISSRLTILIALVFPLQGSGSLKEVMPEKKPNVIFILTDDQGYGDFGFYGNPHVQSPVLDSLASQSIRFSQFYVNPVCTPTRASLLTGRYAINTGIYDTWNGGDLMHNEELTLAEIMKDAGYETGIFGKWHLGDNYPFRPNDQGFTKSVVHRSGGLGKLVYSDRFIFRDDSSYFNPILLNNGKEKQYGGYCSDIFTQEAIHFIDNTLENNPDKPFFLYLSFNAVHNPLQVPEEYYNLYRDMSIRSEDYPSVGRTLQLNPSDIEKARRVYAMVTNIDDNLRNLFNYLKEKEISENTIIVFLTDNGPQTNRYNTGLRARKGSVYEGGIKVPCFLHWKGQITGNVDLDFPTANIDILPTILELCNINIPTDLELDGQSLAPFILGEKESMPDRTLFFEFNRGFLEPYRNIAVRKGKYKLVGKTGYLSDLTDFELYNIDEDPYEMTDKSEENQEITKILKTEFDNWYSKVIKNPHLVDPPRIIIGSEFESPVLLTRDEWKSDYSVPWLKGVSGYWDINVAEEDQYNIKVLFGEAPQPGSTIFLQAGTVRLTRTIREEPDKLINPILPIPETYVVDFPDVLLFEGDCMIKAWGERGKKRNYPLYISAEKENE